VVAAGAGHTGVDVGGTFTDAVAWDGARLRSAKVLTTPDQSEGVLAGFQAVSGGETLLHGTTAATNALLERAGARTALVTDAGFEDLLEIGRQDRPSLYDTSVTRPVPLVERSRRVGMTGRSDRRGRRPAGADPAEVAARVAALSPEAVAVCLLYSFVDGAAERRLAGALRRRLPGVPVSLSSVVAPEFREFERASTTVVNAYLTPVVAGDLESLHRRVRAAGVERVAVMRSSGGLMSLEEAAALPAAILLSGPAGGVVAAAALGRALGHEHLVSFDMGGTSTDVCRIEDGRPEVAYERAIDGYPCRLPAVAVHTIGAGGGSLGWVDAGGALRVGPRSAGALPGPACYGRGGRAATVTDAHVVLGRLDPSAHLAGSLEVDAAAARAAVERLGSEAGLERGEAALGMVEVVEAHMQRALRRVSVEQGADPRQAVLVAFGGAGGLHGSALARRLEMAGLAIPAHAGVFSALGLLLAPPRVDVARSVAVADGPGLDAAVTEVIARAAESLAAASPGGELRVRAHADVRYRGQSHEIPVTYRPGEGWARLATRFHRAHRQRNGFDRPGDPIEVVTVRAEAVGSPALRWEDLPSPRPQGEPSRGGREVLTAEGSVEAAVWWRPALAPGQEVLGPAVVEEPDATTWLAPGERAVVHPGGALEVSW
jgi:N-methylhydantoinase A